jgi:hypothetical protein
MIRNKAQKDAKMSFKLSVFELQIKNRAQMGIICSSKRNKFELELRSD